MSISIFTTDANLIVRSWDFQMASMTGLNPEQACGRSLLEIIPDLETRGIRQRFDYVLATGAIETLAPAFHHYLLACPVRTESRYFQYMQQRVTIAPLRDQEAIVGTVVTLEDVTQRLEGERLLSARLAQYPISASPETLEELRSLDWPDRQAAIQQLSQLERPNLTEDLVNVLRKEHHNPNILNSLLQVLTLSRVDPIPALIECLQEPDHDLRIYATLTLGRRKDPRAIPALIEALKDTNTNVRYHAIEALSLLQAKEAADQLLAIAESEDFFLAFPALEALAKIFQDPNAQKLEVSNREETTEAEPAWRQLLPLLQNTLDWRVRREAVDNLTLQNNPDLAVELLQLLRQRHQNPNLLNSVLQILILSHLDPVPPLIECLNDPDPDLRIYAALALGERHDPRSIPPLIEHLEDSNQNVCFHVIEALGHLQAIDAVERLVEIVESRDFFLSFPAITALMKISEGVPSTAVFRVAAGRLVPLLQDELLAAITAEALGQFGDVDGVPAMVNLFNPECQIGFPTNADPLSPTALFPYGEIAKAIARIHHRYHHLYGEGSHVGDLIRNTLNPGGIQTLLTLVETCRHPQADPKVLEACVLLLGYLQTEMIIEPLAQLLSHSGVQEAVVTALVRFGTKACPALIAQLDAEDVNTRLAAIAALGRIGSPQAVPALTQVISNSNGTPDSYYQTDLSEITTAAHALAQIGDQRAFEALLRLLGHPESSVRLGAIAALNSLGHPAMSERMVGLLADPNPWIRESAVKIAGYFAFRECLESLLALTRDPEARVRRAALEHLPYLDDLRSFSILIAALRQEVPEVRVVAARALGELGEQEALPDLVAALNDEEPWVRYQAARSIGKLAGKVMKNDPLIDRLTKVAQSDPDLPVRAAATEALGRVGGETVIPILAGVVERDTGDVARAAIQALGTLESAQAVPPLLAALNSPVADRRLDAIQAFRNRSGTEASVALQWLAAADPDERVAQAAIESLARMATPDSIAALLELTVDSRHREACAIALANRYSSSLSGQLEFISCIAPGLMHIHASVRCSTIDILKRFKHPQATEYIASVLSDRDRNVRLAAVSALVECGNHYYDEQLALLARTDPVATVRRAAQKAL